MGNIKNDKEQCIAWSQGERPEEHDNVRFAIVETWMGFGEIVETFVCIEDNYDAAYKRVLDLIDIQNKSGIEVYANKRYIRHDTGRLFQWQYFDAIADDYACYCVIKLVPVTNDLMNMFK